MRHNMRLLQTVTAVVSVLSVVTIRTGERAQARPENIFGIRKHWRAGWLRYCYTGPMSGASLGFVQMANRRGRNKSAVTHRPVLYFFCCDFDSDIQSKQIEAI